MQHTSPDSGVSKQTTPFPAMTSPIPEHQPQNAKNIDDASMTEKRVKEDIEQQRQQNAGNDDRLSAFKSLGFLDRFLAIWIFLAMLIGILLGNFVENTGPALQKGTFVGVSLPIGAFRDAILCRASADLAPVIGLLVMMYPILCKVQYEKLHEAFRGREIWVQLAFSVVINWIVAPLIMVKLT